MSNQNINPMEAAHDLYAECVLASLKGIGAEEQTKKLEDATKGMEAFIDWNINFWLQVKNEWNALIEIGKNIDESK